MLIAAKMRIVTGQMVIESAPGKTSVQLLAPLGDPLSARREAAITPIVGGAAPEPGATAATMAGVIRVLLADDHSVVREGIANTINQAPDLLVVGEAATGASAVALAQSLRPDVVVLDINMSDMNGIAAARAIKVQLPQIHIVGLSIHNDETTARAMLDAGASAYVPKDAPADHLRDAIRNAMGKVAGK